MAFTAEVLSVAMTPTYAPTDWKAEGQMMEHIIVDLAELRVNTLDVFHTYVASSQLRGRETIRLLQDFRHELLQKHPSVHLIPEDKHLRVLNEFTKLKFELRSREGT